MWVFEKYIRVSRCTIIKGSIDFRKGLFSAFRLISERIYSALEFTCVVTMAGNVKGYFVSVEVRLCEVFVRCRIRGQKITNSELLNEETLGSQR